MEQENKKTKVLCCKVSESLHTDLKLFSIIQKQTLQETLEKIISEKLDKVDEKTISEKLERINENITV